MLSIFTPLGVGREKSCGADRNTASASALNRMFDGQACRHIPGAQTRFQESFLGAFRLCRYALPDMKSPSIGRLSMRPEVQREPTGVFTSSALLKEPEQIGP